MSRAIDAVELKISIACSNILEDGKSLDQIIDEQPTVEPQRKKGTWIFKERREPVYDLSGVKTWGIAYMCSECGFIHTLIEDFGQYAYCPNSNCGAEMEIENGM